MKKQLNVNAGAVADFAALAIAEALKIAAAHLHKFVQLEDPSPRKWGGKGLGLAFC